MVRPSYNHEVTAMKLVESSALTNSQQPPPIGLVNMGGGGNQLGQGLSTGFSVPRAQLLLVHCSSTQKWEKYFSIN